MASFFGHAATALTIGRLTGGTDSRGQKRWLFWAALAASATAADLDVIGFWFGIPYQSDWGHRGFTHSAVFAAVLAAALAKALPGPWLKRFVVFFAAALTHPLLDMLTNGGLGVAIFWPFDGSRYFLPYRPIEVSPLGVGAFFSQRGVDVLASEGLFIFLPCAVALGIHWIACARRRAS